MIIRRVEVQNFRKLVEPTVIENLPDGLVIVVGENEEGKSTLLEAVRSCFFDKHNITGERAQGFQPYKSALRPEVRVEFEINGQRFKLFKAFCLRPQAELVTPSGRLADAAAEEELARLLRFTPPQRARRESSDHEHEGIFGMFWVEQGKSFIGVSPTTDGRSSIQEALHREVGDVLGGKRGQKILAEVTKLRRELLTPTGRPTGEFARAADRKSKIQAELATIEDSFRDYGRNLEELERCRARQRRYETERTPERAEDRLREAREAAQKVGALGRTVDQAEAKLAEATVEHNLAATLSEQRSKDVNQVEASKVKLAHLKSAWSTKNGTLAEAHQQAESREKELLKAVERFEQTATAYAVAAAAEKLAQVQANMDNLLRQEREAAQARTKAEKALQAAAAIGVEKRDVSRLKILHDAVTTAQAQLDALATHVRVELQPGVKARMGRTTVVSGVQHRLTETTVIEVTDCARITVVPGGDIGNPRAEVRRVQDNFERALKELGVSRLTEAEDKLQERQNLLKEAKNYQDLTDAHAPDGLDTLQASIAELRGETQRLTKQAGGKPHPLREAAAALKEAQRERDDADQARKLAEKRGEQARKEQLSAQTDEAGCRASFESEEARLHDLEANLAKNRKANPDSQLQNAVVAAAQKVTTAEQTATAARRLLENANPEAVRLELSAAEDAFNQLQKDLRELSDRVIRLESELRATGAQGLGERIQQLEADLQSAKAVADAFERRAKTIELLHKVLTEAERAAKETFLRPVTDRVQPYLKLLLPDSELLLSEAMDIAGLRRGGVEEDFAALSLGTREQLAVLTRLAFADLLRENAQPAAVLLDDAIVFADDGRFKRMLHILRKAAERTQIIVFTCHERNYEAAGAPLLRLAECRARAAGS
jgi:uncharacterized protein YhaN